MFDWLRNLRKTEEEKQRERLTAYIDDALSAAERQAFERELADNDELRATVEAEQQVKLLLNQAPRLRAPRNFTLDPAVYGVPQRPTLATRLYPQLRVATAVMAVLLVGVISLEFLSVPVGEEASAPMQDIAQVQPAAESQEFALESTEIAEDTAMDMAEEMTEEIAEEAEEEMADEAMAEESIVIEEEVIIEEAEAELALEEASAEEPTAADDMADTDEATDAEADEDAEMETADDAAESPRPNATALPDTRIEEPPTATPPPSPTVQPSPTAPPATIAPPSPPADDPPLDLSLSPLRITQILIGLATAVLLGLTLYFRRRL